MLMLWTLVLAALLIGWLWKLNDSYFVLALFAKRIKTADGSDVSKILAEPKGKTIFGNTFDANGLDAEGLFKLTRDLAEQSKKSYVQYVMGMTFYNIIDAADAELIMTDQNLITKGLVYLFLQPFLRFGLLTSTNKYWHSRRKMLTPTFHFNILGQFEEIFKEESKKFVENLQAQANDVISLNNLIPIFTLNNVCETALGIKLDDRLDGSQYRESFSKIDECFSRRLSNPLLMNDFFYNMLEAHKYEPHLKIVHKFSSEIIEKRRKLFALEMKKKSSSDAEFETIKKRYAMLDTLLLAEQQGQIDHIGICEEVDTFMFEGFDTTSMGLIFAFMNLSVYPEMQEKCYQEIQQYIDDDLSKLEISQLSNLKYLDLFMKENLRMYPPVPAIMRKATKETKLSNNLILPAGCEISLHIFDIQRNPKYFPNPDVFDPERFSNENSARRHPYAFVPFSAGQRNCIGQKFAWLEMKTLIVYMLKHYQLLPLVDPKKFQFESGIIIRAKTDVKVQLVRRN